MSGGIAYVFDERGDFSEKRCNRDSVDLEPLIEPEDFQRVRDLVARHLELTGSPRAKWILGNWNEAASRFIKVFPHEFKRVLGISRTEQANVPGEPDSRLVAEEQVQHG
jgi:glutamate synthase domain-containing protein 3